jgi:hypothetical protein
MDPRLFFSSSSSAESGKRLPPLPAHSVAAVAEAAADPTRAISIDPGALGLPGWALAGVAGGALVSAAVSLVAAEEPGASASGTLRPRDARK